jgi:hypothetical protein
LTWSLTATATANLARPTERFGEVVAVAVYDSSRLWEEL